MTTLEKIRAEIEMEKNTFKKTSTEYKDIFHQGKFCAFDESLRIIDKYAEQEPCDDDYQTDMDEAWKQAKREPCDDVVSREKAVRCVLSSMFLAEASEKIEQLPSVRPQEQAGKWLEHENGRWIYAKCSECKTIHDSRSNYCPFCGARMDGYFAGLTKLRGE